MPFNLFGKKEEHADRHLFVDRAYVSTAAKMQACADLAAKDPGTVFIAWFADTANTFRTFFREKGLDENRVVETNHVHASKILNKTPVFVEHYPMHANEIELIKNWDIKNILVYSAMDEPLFKHFGSEKLIPLMKMLGMKENEVIEHSMVSKSIIKGQEKIAAQVSMEQSANSQDEWMRKNIK